MPQEKNPLLRLLVPILIGAVGLGIAYAVFKGSNPAAGTGGQPQSQTQTQQQAKGDAPAAPAQPGSTPKTPATNPDQPAGAPADPSAGAAQAQPTPAPETPQPGVQTPSVVGLKARSFGEASLTTAFTPVGAVEKNGEWKMRLSFSPAGGGLARVELADHFQAIRGEMHTLVQEQRVISTGSGAAVLAPFAALAVDVTIAGATTRVPLGNDDQGRPVWREVSGAAPGTLEAFVTDASGNDVLRLERRWTLEPGSYSALLTQKIFNLTTAPVSVKWIQLGPVEFQKETSSYGGDRRFVRFGYMLPREADPAQKTVIGDSMAIDRSDLLGKAGTWGEEKVLWPSASAAENKLTLSWVGMTSRYFGAAAHAGLRVDDPPKTIPWIEKVSRVVLDGGADRQTACLRFDSVTAQVQPGGQADMSIGVFMGPLDKRVLRGDPRIKDLSLTGMVVYNFGGPCGFCTFQWIADLLLRTLHVLHNLTGDWGVAIILLVLLVRTLLHPVTKWSQIKLARFGKQMQSMAPKQKQIQEKYKDDPTKQQQEMAKLWREEGIAPSGALGCITPLLQTPIWLGISTVIFFAAELRHQPAFYGLFQSIQPQGSPFWWFLGDLSEPDRFWYFAGSPEKYIHIPLISGLMGPIGSVNLMPVLLGIVFFIQQKYMTPPTAPNTMTPEQEMQMKMTKVMMVFLFPFMMYNSPSGLSLYFLANSTLGILEAKWIRAHMDKHGLLDLDKMKAERDAKRKNKGGEPGFLQRAMQIAEQKQREANERKRRNPGR